MELTTLMEVFLFIVALSAIVVASAIAFVAYHIYLVVRTVETAGERLVKGISLFEESIKKLSFFRKAERTKRKTKRDDDAAEA